MARFRSLAFSHTELASETQYGRNLRRELTRWFPNTAWATAFNHPGVRLAARERRALEQCGGTTDNRAALATGSVGTGSLGPASLGNGSREDRRAFVRQFTLAGAGLLLPSFGCAAAGAIAAGVVFRAIQAAATEYALGSAAGGSATFGSDSQSREKAQLGTALMLADTDEVQDENEELVPVPARADDWSYAFEGLLSGFGGDHVISGTAVGVTLLTEVFAFL